jgi:hypothetical protein
MRPEEYRAEAYRLGHRFARGRLGAGEAPDTVRVALDRAQEVLLGLRAYSADLEEMMRLGVEDVLAGRPMDRRHAAPPGRRLPPRPGRARHITMEGRRW